MLICIDPDASITVYIVAKLLHKKTQDTFVQIFEVNSNSFKHSIIKLLLLSFRMVIKSNWEECHHSTIYHPSWAYWYKAVLPYCRKGSLLGGRPYHRGCCWNDRSLLHFQHLIPNNCLLFVEKKLLSISSGPKFGPLQAGVVSDIMQIT